MTEKLVADIKNEIILIEKSVCFYPDQNLLKSLHGEDSVKLLSTASECLLILIQSQGDIVPKHEFIEKVWGRKGVIATEHTFYQTILTVRKGFSHLGLENIIKTRYRRGLLIESSVSIIKREMVVSGVLSHYESNNNTNYFHERVQTQEKKYKKNRWSLWLSVALWIFVGVVLGGLTASAIKIPSSGYFDRYHQLTYMKSACPILAEDYKYDPDQIQSFFRQNKIECTRDEKIYFSGRNSIGLHSLIKCDNKFQEGKECLTDFYLSAVQEK
ncbi:winged helix-turn-helix domain-containing protein [Enterobacter sp. NFIX58]|uniref:winged helix-turn-helix domain-containing protein n=1 Tax=Enterobacter sp. NFIX58 TaxID=1566251 RepID=UPI0008D42DCA|nr:winged helix-turn-helix domain-containing protein [Enterobacter sp. NFIX58]SEO96376.1 Transcriptional regulatory protein, C terminal [Enterobacter sp. NFIX58]